jgi:hypothetical protein
MPAGDAFGRSDRLPEHPAMPTAAIAANGMSADLKLMRNTRTSKAKEVWESPHF